MAGVGLAGASRTPSARALPGLQQGSYRGVVVIPGKDLSEGLAGFLGKDLAEVRCLLLLGFRVLFLSS